MDEKINGRTTEEIKKALGLCPHFGCESFEECAYEDEVGFPGNLMMDALALIEHLESERDAALAKVPKWISVKEKTPKDRQIVYMHTSNRRTFKGIYLSHTGFERYKHGDGWMSVKNVTHWTTLPELPKEGE